MLFLPGRAPVTLEFVRAQGWYRDPYGRHGDRWFSDGRPTWLVRDGRRESRDTPPPGEPPMPLTPVPFSAVRDGGDLRRADELTRKDQSYDAKEMVRKLLDSSGAWGIGFR